MRSPRPRRTRLLQVALAMLAAEASSWLALALTARSASPVRAVARERSALLAVSDDSVETAGVPATASWASTREGLDRLLGDPVHRRRRLHPYLGYVYASDSALDRARRAAGFPMLASPGFYETRSMREARMQPRVDDFRVGIFGGSVAMMVTLQAEERFVRGLAAHPRVAGRRVVVRSVALGGYKQPQQALALAYLMAEGERFDLVINLDGFNEIALPWLENQPARQPLDFPRSWAALLGEAGPALLARRGELAWLERRRARWAELAEATPLRHVAMVNLVWKVRDARLAAALDRARAGTPEDVQGPWTLERAEADERSRYQELSLAVWREGSVLMRELTRSAGGEYYHFLQPNLHDPALGVILSAEDRQRRTAGDALYGDVVRGGYPRLESAGAELRGEGIDFTSLRGMAVEIEGPATTDVCCHFTPAVNAAIAGAIVERLAEAAAGAASEGSHMK